MVPKAHKFLGVLETTRRTLSAARQPLRQAPLGVLAHRRLSVTPLPAYFLVEAIIGPPTTKATLKSRLVPGQVIPMQARRVVPNAAHVAAKVLVAPVALVAPPVSLIVALNARVLFLAVIEPARLLL